jgi:uronate dehydrogenase
VRVLITGAAGRIGRVVHAGLTRAGHEVVAFDLVAPPPGAGQPWHTVDCADPDAVTAVFADEHLDGVVHLAGNPGETSLPDSLTSHAITTAALLDAMVEHRVDRIVYASSNHAVGLTPRQELLTDGARVRPDTFYGVAKVTGEALLSLYADRHGIDAIACRIGSFRERPTSVRELSTWLSHDDCVRMVEAALTAPAPGFAVLYGVSANTRGWWDLAPGRLLGYQPVDDAEDHANEITPSVDDAPHGARVGGGFAMPEAARRALS